MSARFPRLASLCCFATFSVCATPVCFCAASTSSLYEVASESDLFHAISSVERRFALGEKDNVIVLTHNIELTTDIHLPSGCVLDLNGHDLIIKPGASILTGEKKLHKVKSWQEWHDVPRRKSIYKGKNPDGSEKWGYEYYTERIAETKIERIYKYDDSAYVEIIGGSGATCGRIIGKEACAKGFSPVAGEPYWLVDAHGKSAKDEKPVIIVMSGSLALKNVVIKANDGGNGGDATYSSLWRVLFFGGGDGGNGGNGGNGRDVFFVERGHGRVFVQDACTFIPGKGGEGGKGSGPNPNYWLIAGSTGHDGRRGNDGVIGI